MEMGKQGIVLRGIIERDGDKEMMKKLIGAVKMENFWGSIYEMRLGILI